MPCRLCDREVYDAFWKSADTNEKLFIDDMFWMNARKMFDNDKSKVIPVYDQDMRLSYFVRYEYDLSEKWEKFCELRERVDDRLLKELKQIKSVHIKGINDVLYGIRKWLTLIGVEVSVEGEIWNLFGIEESKYITADADIIDEECQWIDLLYSKYTNWLNKYSLQLKRRLIKPYINKEKEKVLFFLPYEAYFVDSMYPLISYYIQKGKECVVVLNSIECVMKMGYENISKVLSLIDKLETVGACCYSAHLPELCNDQYEICFLCSEYSGELPYKFRRITRLVVSLQTSALYTHTYYIEDRFDKIFSGVQLNQIDYLVVADYTADWICKRNKMWEKKLLRYGYPKLDTLYHTLNDNVDIPEDWKKKAYGKKVFLILSCNNMPKSWIDMTACSDKSILLWRPHPIALADAARKLEREKLMNDYPNIIIDSNVSYYAAFKLSDAAIAAPPVSSSAVNYLYMGKPLCIYDTKEENERTVIDYRQEMWYKSAYAAYEENAVLEFMQKVEDGIRFTTEDQKRYYQRIQSNFDGKVCQRVYDYLEKAKE